MSLSSYSTLPMYCELGVLRIPDIYFVELALCNSPRTLDVWDMTGHRS